MRRVDGSRKESGADNLTTGEEDVSSDAASSVRSLRTPSAQRPPRSEEASGFF